MALISDQITSFGPIFFSLLYLYYIKYYTFWELHGIKGPKPWPFFGNCFGCKRKTGLNRIRFGHVYGIYKRTKPVLVITNPDLVRKVLLDDAENFNRLKFFNTNQPIIRDMLISADGSEWARLKQLAAPALASTTVTFDSMNVTAKNFGRVLTQQANAIDLSALANLYSLDIVTRTVFSAEISSILDPGNQLVKNCLQVKEQNPWTSLVAALLPTCLVTCLNLPLFSTEVITFFKDLTVQLIAERQKSSKKDILKLLIDAQLGSTSNSEEIVEKDGSKNYLPGHLTPVTCLTTTKLPSKCRQRLSDDEITGQALLFLFCGHEPIRTILTQCLLELAGNQDVQRTLRNELDSIEWNISEDEHGALEQLEYLDAVVSETLRLHPPDTMTWRTNVSSFEIEESGTQSTIPPGTSICIDIAGIHGDANNYADPEQFKPERFLAKNRHQIKPFTFLPFGGGPGACIGVSFSLLAIKLAIKEVLLHHRVSVHKSGGALRQIFGCQSAHGTTVVRLEPFSKQSNS